MVYLVTSVQADKPIIYFSQINYLILFCPVTNASTVIIKDNLETV